MGATPPHPPYSNNLYIITYVSNFKKYPQNQGGGVDRHSTPLSKFGGGVVTPNPHPPVWRPCICPSPLIDVIPFSTYIAT